MDGNPSNKKEVYNEDHELWLLLNQARHAMFRAREKELGHSGISAMQAAVLTTIESIDREIPATPAEISRRLLRRAHGVSTLLDRMEKEGLIRRVKDLERRNMVRVVITEKGHAAYRESSKRRVVHQVMASLTEDERKALRSGLMRLRDGALERLRLDSQPAYPTPVWEYHEAINQR
jgi:MarR family transcriptional regulator, organic hydroperoxide resistance regulator